MQTQKIHTTNPIPANRMQDTPVGRVPTGPAAREKPDMRKPPTGATRNPAGRRRACPAICSKGLIPCGRLSYPKGKKVALRTQLLVVKPLCHALFRWHHRLYCMKKNRQTRLPMSRLPLTDKGLRSIIDK